MKYCLGVLILLGMIGTASAQQANWLWAKGGGGKGNDQSSSIAADSVGNIYVTGYYVDSAVFSGISLHPAKGSHLFLAKYSSLGSLLWIRTTGAVTGQSQGTGVSIGANKSLYVTGYFSDSLSLGSTILRSIGTENIFLAKYDLDGNIEWAVSAGGTGYDFGRSVSTDTSENIYITGSFSGSSDFSGKQLTSVGGDDIFIAKYDSNGSVIWVKSFGSQTDDAGWGITVGHSGTIAVTGLFGDTIDFSGIKLISKGISDIFITKFSSDGVPLWVQQAGDTSVGKGQSIAMDRDENVYVTGNFVGGGIVPDCDGVGNIYIAKYSSGGVKEWMKCVGTGGEEFGAGVAVDSSGLYVTGGYDNTINFGSGQIPNNGLFDIFIVKFDVSGNALWTDHAGAPKTDLGSAVALDPNGDLYLSGIFSDTCTFGAFSLQSFGNTDIFIAEIGTNSDVHELHRTTNDAISFYPNPAKDKINIDFISDSKEDPLTIEIFSLLGVPIKKIIAPYSGIGNQIISILVGDLAKGIYLCRIISAGNMTSRTVVVGD